MYEWILFDLDNTLTDFDHSSHTAFNQLCEYDLYIPFTEELYQSYKLHNGLMWQAFERNEIDTQYLRWKRFELFFNANNIKFDTHLANEKYLRYMTEAARLKPGALKLIQDLHRDYGLVIVTNGLKENQRTILENLDLTKYFEQIVVSDEIGYTKPHEGFFEHTFELLAHPDKHTALVVGDNLGSDIEGAVRYGLDSCWYNPDNKVNHTNWNPSYEVVELSQILEIVNKRKF